jgi:hypothetical protein
MREKRAREGEGMAARFRPLKVDLTGARSPPSPQASSTLWAIVGCRAFLLPAGSRLLIAAAMRLITG